MWDNLKGTVLSQPLPLWRCPCQRAEEDDAAASQILAQRKAEEVADTARAALQSRVEHAAGQCSDKSVVSELQRCDNTHRPSAVDLLKLPSYARDRGWSADSVFMLESDMCVPCSLR